jgi:hypothetical protein
MIALGFGELDRLAGIQHGPHDVVCPLCGPYRKPRNQRLKTLRIWRQRDDFLTFCCAHCGERGHASRPAVKRLSESNRDTAAWLWGRREPIGGTIAETYLRKCRRYVGPLPPTLGFLPARGEYGAAMIAAFGLTTETEPGALRLDKVAGVHLTRLKPDGMDKAAVEKPKIMIGRGHTMPIVLAAPTDMLSIVIAEGIEDALSAHQALGMGAWAAGSADRLPAMAEHVPDYIEAVTIMVDDDHKGERNSIELARRLRMRGIEARLAPMGN